MSFIEMNHIGKSFGNLEVLKDVSLHMESGEVVSIIGPSGSGKSTFLRCLCELEKIDKGDICVGGEVMAEQPEGASKTVYSSPDKVRQICRRMGMVFQSFNLFPHMTVLDNILEAPRVVKGMKDADILPLAEELLRKVGLWDKRDVYPSSLSGGQKQRVAIARAILKDAPVIILDEVTAFADPENEIQIQAALKELTKGKTVIMIAHRLSTIQDADQILVMKAGSLVEQGTHQELLAKRGLYYETYMAQYGTFLGGEAM